MAFSARKTWRPLVMAAALALAVGFGVYFFLVGPRRQEAIAEADRLDPGWRLEELEQEREVLADEENGALAVLAAAKLWPVQASNGKEDFWAEGGMEESIIDLPPQMQLNAEQRAALKKELEKAAPALQEARKLLHLSRGRYPESGSPENGSAGLACQEARRIATLLYLDSLLQAQDHQEDGALATALAVVNAGRSIGDEHIAISQLVRLGCGTLAIRNLERVLAAGEPSRKILVAAQESFQDEASQPLLLWAARGDRADTYRKMTTSKIPFWLPGDPYASVFQLQNQCVEAAKAPPEEQLIRLQRLKGEASKLGPFSALWFRSFENLVQASVRYQAWLRCACVGLAVERYRQARGHWPDALAALVPEFLAELPLDPYNASPLGYRRLENGVVIYTVGPDGQDNGGKLDRKGPLAEGTDIGFQLWDVNHRRQPWRPLKKAETSDDKKRHSGETNDARERKMEKSLRERLPSGTALAQAQQVMESDGFRCKLMKNEELPEYGLGTRVDYLYCDRTERSSSISNPVVRRWQICLIVQKGVITDIFVSTGLIGP